MPRKYDVTITYTIEAVETAGVNGAAHIGAIEKAQVMVQEGWDQVYISDITLHETYEPVVD